MAYMECLGITVQLNLKHKDSTALSSSPCISPPKPTPPHSHTVRPKRRFAQVHGEGGERLEPGR